VRWGNFDIIRFRIFVIFEVKIHLFVNILSSGCSLHVFNFIFRTTILIDEIIKTITVGIVTEFYDTKVPMCIIAICGIQINRIWLFWVVMYGVVIAYGGVVTINIEVSIFPCVVVHGHGNIFIGMSTDGSDCNQCWQDEFPVKVDHIFRLEKVGLVKFDTLLCPVVDNGIEF